MARLIYSAIMSLDGYTADADGHFEWAAPDEEVHAFVNELERPAGTYLYGRRMYETMRSWETAHTLPGQPGVSLDYARIWQAADKIVYSTTLPAADTARTRVERDFDPDQGCETGLPARYYALEPEVHDNPHNPPGPARLDRDPDGASVP